MSAPCPILGFVVELQLQDGLSDAAAEAFRCAADELFESRGLSGSRQHRGTLWSFIVQSEAAQPTESDREAVLAWARGRQEVANAWAGPIGDLSQ